MLDWCLEPLNRPPGNYTFVYNVQCSGGVTNRVVPDVLGREFNGRLTRSGLSVGGGPANTKNALVLVVDSVDIGSSMELVTQSWFQAPSMFDDRMVHRAFIESWNQTVPPVASSSILSASERESFMFPGTVVDGAATNIDGAIALVESGSSFNCRRAQLAPGIGWVGAALPSSWWLPFNQVSFSMEQFQGAPPVWGLSGIQRVTTSAVRASNEARIVGAEVNPSSLSGLAGEAASGVAGAVSGAARRMLPQVDTNNVFGIPWDDLKMVGYIGVGIGGTIALTKVLQKAK